MARDTFPLLPAGFRFGTVSAAHAVEGALGADGGGESVWERFSRLPGRIADGSRADTAADGYRRGAEDIDLLRGLGTRAHRFSLSWPRLMPDLSGRVNTAALDHYDRYLDLLLEAGQEPMVTLYHRDLPQALEDDGGWLNPATVERFAHYASVVGERLADRVAHWVPVNEPSVVTFLGYADGRHAPGKRLLFDALWPMHHLLLGHGSATIELRRAGATSVGCANHHAPMWPASEDDADVGASKLFDALWNGAFIEPMLLGRYPTDVAPLMEALVAPGDLATIRQPLDFYGVNYYHPIRVAAAGMESDVPFEILDVLGHPLTDGGWPVVPDALREWLVLFRARFRAALPPIVVTESGCAYRDEPGPDGVVVDQRRIDYLAAHVNAVAEAVNRGVDVRGYYTWSLLDCWEWTEGFSQRFGLVHVDFETQQRTPKASYGWYRDLVAAQPG